MKKILFLLILAIPCYPANAQTTAESLLGELPPIPANVCTGSTEIMEDFEKAIRAVEIKTAHGLLLTFWETYERMNAMQDEASRIMFTGYPCSTQDGGFLLDGIKLYIEELREAYEWNPANEVMDELGVGSE